MTFYALVIGGALIGVGVAGYSEPGLFGEFDKVSPTSLIPVAIGGVLVLSGLLVFAKPSTRKHAAHAAALAGLLGVVGGFMPMSRSNFNFAKASAISGLLMSALSLLFVVLCVKSFIDARKARQ